MSRPRLFWDSSALIDAVFACEKSPYRELLNLGEIGVVDMRLSPDVLRECDAVLRKYGETSLSLFAIVICNAGFATTPFPDKTTVDYCEQLTGYRKDAAILAAAEECNADILVTHDKQHFIGNPLISPPDTHCRVMQVTEALSWCFSQITAY